MKRWECKATPLALAHAPWHSEATVEGSHQRGSDRGKTQRPGHAPTSAWQLLGDTSGVIYVEYIVLVLLVGIFVALAIISIGVPLLESFRMSQSFLGAPIP